MSKAETIIELRGIKKVYQMGGHALEALSGVSLEIGRGEFVSVMGPSGSGKSTLMNIIGCLDTPTSGEYYLEGKNVAGLTFDQLSSIRNQKLGFVFQNFNLLTYATAWENVEVPLLFNGKNARRRRQRITELLEAVGLLDWKEHRPSELSGGEQQRIALARALANDPPILLADEPTGNLDSKSGEDIMGLLGGLWKEGRTIVMVTHDDRIAAHSERTIRLFDGQVA
ncbi:MAG: ABC transporter ATP-binding protein [Candidatus Aminicenantes bacterium]|nr:ABC transporter ATP-binding protein [Candidatus Aminicenantes bacterium]